MSEVLPRKGIFRTEDHAIFCPKIGREYHLAVWLPPSYATENKAHPVIYVLDGDVAFGMAAGFTVMTEAAEAIVVGTHYEMESYAQWATLRELDFKMPQVKDSPPDSYADRFLEALTEEMIPLIDAAYRTTPSDRCIYGYSSSGFFVLYALFHRPDAFQHYLAGSGDLDIAYLYLSERGQKLAARQADPPVQLYLTVGELEENLSTDYHNFLAFFEKQRFPGLTVIPEIFSGEGHTPVGSMLTYLRGIRKVFPALNPAG